MSTRRTQFFMRPAEVQEWLTSVVEDLKLVLILEAFPSLTKPRLVEVRGNADLTLSDGRTADFIYLSFAHPTQDMLDGPHLNPARDGWADIWMPKERDNWLLMAEIASKSDWYDTLSGAVFENKASHELLGKVRPSLLRRLKRPMWLRSPHQSPEAYEDRTLGYSLGAAEWVHSGGQLKFMDPNLKVEFLIAPPDTTGSA